MPILPPEILEDIFSIFLSTPNSGSVLCLLRTSSNFLQIGQRFLYSQLRFTTQRQLASFISLYSLPKHILPYAPRSVELDIPRNTGSHSLFTDIHAIFSRCLPNVKDAQRDENGRYCLDSLYLRLNSHFFDSKIEMIYSSLSLINPRRFTWTGPAPPHHISIAIIPQAKACLFRALSEYTNLVYLKLTHISLFPVVGEMNHLPIIPSLRTFYLCQVIHLNPASIAALIFDPNSENLEKLYLIDAYLESIWGPRLRRSDVEKAAVKLIPTADNVGHPAVLDENTRSRIHQIITCMAQTERIMGGDRVENTFLV
ncbi:hypothetical protein BDN70DRAFT_882883 [Pholiota conissans]|uniref:Uncharacterized protein n=1 Tax=Pholiota conissans TaxID=109636 RepID=A0A9P5YUV6_9AGAR|nr:hypothetical protein BDN70DRAFT_882883 [Pholiota conissans]